jgi:hypothetical protein
LELAAEQADSEARGLSQVGAMRAHAGRLMHGSVFQRPRNGSPPHWFVPSLEARVGRSQDHRPREVGHPTFLLFFSVSHVSHVGQPHFLVVLVDDKELPDIELNSEWLKSAGYCHHFT